VASCPGNGEEHCCWIAGEQCAFLEEGTVSGRRWACGLRRELGSWEAVHGDARYVEAVQPFWDSRPDLGPGCGDWPLPGMTCATCGVSGDG
jgi:hypothetical protein